MHGLADRNVVIGLKSPLGSRVGKFAIAHQDTKTPRVQKRLVDTGDGFGDQSPADLPLDFRAIAAAPGLGGIVEGFGVDDRSIEKVMPRTMCEAVGFLNVCGPEVPRRDHDTVGGFVARKLLEIGVSFTTATAGVAGLAQ